MGWVDIVPNPVKKVRTTIHSRESSLKAMEFQVSDPKPLIIQTILFPLKVGLQLGVVNNPERKELERGIFEHIPF